MVDYLLRCALRPDQPRPSIETLLHAFVPAPHVDHTHPDAVIALTSSPDGRGARRGGVRRRGRLARLPAARLRHVAPDRLLLEEHPAARAVLLEKHGLVTWGEQRRGELRGDDRVRRARRRCDRAARRRAVRPRRPASRGARRRERRALLLASSLPALRGALLARRRRARARGRPKPGGGRVRVVRARAGGEPDRRAVPRPPDQHQAQAARRRVRPGRRAMRRSSPRRSAPASTSTPTGTATTTSATSTTRRGRSRSTRRAPRRARARRRHRHDRRRRRARARRARPLPPRDRRRGRRRRARRLPFAERERGVRDRVLAARALQARAGAAAPASSPAASR